MRQSFTTSGFDGIEYINWIVCPFTSESGTQHGPLIKDAFLLFLSKEVPEVLHEGTNFIMPIGCKSLRHFLWVE